MWYLSFSNSRFAETWQSRDKIVHFLLPSGWAFVWTTPEWRKRETKGKHATCDQTRNLNWPRSHWNSRRKSRQWSHQFLCSQMEIVTFNQGEVKFSFYISGFCALFWLRKSGITHLYHHLPLLEPGPHHSGCSQCLIHNFGPRGPRMTVPWLASCLLHLPVPVQVLWPWGVLSVQWGQMCWGVTSLGAILKQRRKGVGV